MVTILLPWTLISWNISESFTKEPKYSWTAPLENSKWVVISSRPNVSEAKTFQRFLRYFANHHSNNSLNLHPLQPKSYTLTVSPQAGLSLLQPSYISTPYTTILPYAACHLQIAILHGFHSLQLGKRVHPWCLPASSFLWTLKPKLDSPPTNPTAWALLISPPRYVEDDTWS